MNYVIILLVNFTVLIILKLVIGANINQIKKKGKNKEIEEITYQYPNNKEICEYILKKFGKNVEIKEEKESKTSYYITVTNTIIIGNIQDNAARIQTIVHECIHSVQNRKILLFNYIYSNLYNLYFIILLILFITKKVNNELLQIFIFFMISILWFIIRNYLEVDAMTRAEYETKEYINETNIVDKEKKNKLIKYYKELNKIRNSNIHFFIIFEDYTKNINILYYNLNSVFNNIRKVK